MREHTATADVRDALGSALCLRDVMRTAEPALLRLLGGDHAALGFTRRFDEPAAATGAALEPGSIEWITSGGLPAEFFADYEHWAAHDFVLAAVARRPRTVLRDSEMVSRSTLEHNPFHRRARELGVPLQHVMAVLLDADVMTSGFAVYRQGKRPFSEREQSRLRELVPALGNAVRNCTRFEAAERRARVLERVLGNRDRALMVFDARGRELFRTERATRLLEHWFGAAARAAAPLPAPLSAAMTPWLARVEDATPRSFWRSGSESVLVVAPEWVADSDRVLLSLVLEERPRPPWSPAAWARLTQRQRAVVAGVVRGWDNQLIASELGCRVATVKRHLTQVYDTLGVGSRSRLMAALSAGGGPNPLA